MISEDSANRLREKLESFGTGPEAGLRRDAYIHNTMIEGSANFQLSVELARIAICSKPMALLFAACSARQQLLLRQCPGLQPIRLKNLRRAPPQCDRAPQIPRMRSFPNSGERRPPADRQSPVEAHRGQRRRSPRTFQIRWTTFRSDAQWKVFR